MLFASIEACNLLIAKFSDSNCVLLDHKVNKKPEKCCKLGHLGKDCKHDLKEIRMIVKTMHNPVSVMHK